MPTYTHSIKGLHPRRIVYATDGHGSWLAAHPDEALPTGFTQSFTCPQNIRRDARGVRLNAEVAAAAAAALGRLGGQTRTPRKATASRANGSRGGRPTSQPARLVAVYAGEIYPDGTLHWDRVVWTTRRSATAAGARLAAKRAGYVLRRAGSPRVDGDWCSVVRDGLDVEVWVVEVERT